MTTTNGARAEREAVARSWPARLLTAVGMLAGAAVVVAGSAGVAVAVAMQQASLDRTYPAAATVELSATDVQVVVGQSLSVGDVLVTASSGYAWRAPDYAATTDGDRLVVSHRCTGSWASGPECSAGLSVRVPARTHIVVHGTNVGVEGETGDVEIVLEGGDATARVTGTEGDVTVRGGFAGGGPGVDVSEVTGDVVVEAGSGPVTVSDIDGSATVETGNGYVDVRAVTGDVDARAAAGSVTVVGTGEPVALRIVGNYESVEGATDPMAATSVTIVAPQGDARFRDPSS